MARARIIDQTQDLVEDVGGVLFSLAQGEQLEYFVTLTFADNIYNGGYEFEAVILEAENVVGQDSAPSVLKPGGIQDTLGVRLLTDLGTWSPTSAYSTDEIVIWNSIYYRLQEGLGRISSLEPQDDPLWIKTTANILWIQFPSTLSTNWTQQPDVNSPTYGFFEVRVSETSGTFKKTWKPARGMVEILFSPTELVP